jgi:hypothetical protein
LRNIPLSGISATAWLARSFKRYVIADNHVFVGRRVGRFEARKINELRTELKVGYWAIEVACG